MRDNPGHLPREAKGKRVRVELRNGYRSPDTWPADGRFGCNWSLSDHPFDIVRYEVI